MLHLFTCHGRIMPRLVELLLTELWHLLDVSAVTGHGAVLAALLFSRNM